MIKRLLARKWLIILATIVTLIVFDSLQTQTSIVQRAIVVGIAVDRTDGELEVSTQIILPRNGGAGEGSNDFACFSAKGKTFDDALRALDLQVGAKTSLSHATVMIFGKDFLESDHIDVLRYLIESDIVPDDLNLLAAEEQAKDLLTVKLPINDVASYHLQRLLGSDVRQMGVNPVNLKEYFMCYFRVNGGCYLPLVGKTQTEPPDESSESGGGDETYYLLDVNRCAIFRQGVYAGVLSRDFSDGLSLIRRELTGGSVPYIDDAGKQSQAQLIKSKASHDYDPSEGVMRLTVAATLRDNKSAFDDDGHVKIAFSQRERDAIAEAFKLKIEGCYRYAKSKNVDIFGVCESVYAATGDKTRAQSALDDVPLTVEIKIKSE